MSFKYFYWKVVPRLKREKCKDISNTPPSGPHWPRNLLDILPEVIDRLSHCDFWWSFQLLVTTQQCLSNTFIERLYIAWKEKNVKIYLTCSPREICRTCPAEFCWCPAKSSALAGHFVQQDSIFAGYQLRKMSGMEHWRPAGHFVWQNWNNFREDCCMVPPQGC